MANLNIELLLRILIAHFLSDFVFQPNNFVKNKEEKGLKSPYFYIHVLITFIIVYLLLWNWNMWSIALIITGTHFILDIIKCQIKKQNGWIFLLDQFLHIVIIIIVWLVFTKQLTQFSEVVFNIIKNDKFLWVLLAYVFITFPVSTLIGFITKKWSNEIEEKNESGKDKNLIKKSVLKDAGKWIGIIERVLIFTFIIINQIAVVGFLLAAKSVFRFGDLKNSSEQKKTEYIIIGTFISFSIAIFVGLLIKYILK
jgi:hypothetical protein